MENWWGLKTNGATHRATEREDSVSDTIELRTMCTSILTDSKPEIGDVPDPDSHSDVDEHTQCPHTHVDTGTSESGI